MFVVSSKTTKSELLQQMAQAVRSPEDQLKIEVKSLPNFLNTPVAFAVFIYQIGKYPKPVFWFSEDDDMMDFLQSCGAKILPDFLRDYVIRKNQLLPSKKAEVVIDISQKKTLEGLIKNARQDFGSDIDPNPQKIDWQNHQSLTFPTSQRLVAQSSQITPSSPREEKIQKYQEKYQDLPTINGISANNLLKKQSYQSSSLLEAEKAAMPEAANAKPKSQDLDTWISRLENAKQSLNSKVKNKSKTEENLPLHKLREKWQSIWHKWQGRSTVFALTGLILAATLGSLSVLAFFPNEVYTLEMTPVKDKSEVILEINRDSFSVQKSTVFAESVVSSSGQKAVTTERAVGKVKLINQGSSPVLITNGAFKLLSNDKAYSHVRNRDLPSTIVIAPNNENSPLEVEIQADQTGDGYNLNDQTRLTVTNLRGEGVCGRCFGLTTGEVKNMTFSDEKVITQTDHEQLRKENEKKIEEERNVDWAKMAAGDVITRREWQQPGETRYTFSREVGQSGKEVSLRTELDLQTFYLKKDTARQLIEQAQTGGFKIRDIDLVEVEGDLNQNSTLPIRLKMNYNFSRWDNLDTERLEETIAQKPLEQVEKDLQSKYPSLKNILKSDKGLNIPGVSPRVSINVVQVEENEPGKTNSANSTNSSSGNSNSDSSSANKIQES